MGSCEGMSTMTSDLDPVANHLDRQVHLVTASLTFSINNTPITIVISSLLEGSRSTILVFR